MGTTPANPSTPALLVAINGTDAFVRILGRVTFSISPAIKQFGNAAMERGGRVFIIDMQSCEGLDSTFMGVLAGLALRITPMSGEMHMINLQPKILDTLRTLGIDQLIRCHGIGQCPPDVQARIDRLGAMQSMEAGPVDHQVTTETMLEAHMDLIQVSGKNFSVFKDVLTFLREDLKQP